MKLCLCKIPEVELSAECRDKVLDRINWFLNHNLKTKVKCILYLNGGAYS